jgi:Cu/Ag efflux protein CusF
MYKKQCGLCVVLFVTCLCLVTAVTNGQQAHKNSHVFRVNKKEFAFRGRVEKVDADAKTLVVTNDNIAGWRYSMTASYTVNNPEVLRDLMPGDPIRAKVYEGDFKVLYDLEVVPPEDTPVFFPRK